MSRKLTLPLMAAMFGLQMGGGSDELRGIDIEKEYELIKQKKSKLSAAKRRAVIYRMEKADK